MKKYVRRAYLCINPERNSWPLFNSGEALSHCTADNNKSSKTNRDLYSHAVPLNRCLNCRKQKTRHQSAKYTAYLLSLHALFVVQLAAVTTTAKGSFAKRNGEIEQKWFFPASHSIRHEPHEKQNLSQEDWNETRLDMNIFFCLLSCDGAMHRRVSFTLFLAKYRIWFFLHYAYSQQPIRCECEKSKLALKVIFLFENILFKRKYLYFLFQKSVATAAAFFSFCLLYSVGNRFLSYFWCILNGLRFVEIS